MGVVLVIYFVVALAMSIVDAEIGGDSLGMSIAIGALWPLMVVLLLIDGDWGSR